jgi:hypothetical protein
MLAQSQKVRSSAYLESVRNYRAGTMEAEAIQHYLLLRLRRVQGAKRLYVYNYAGITGYLAPRVDANKLICFAVFERKDLSAAMQLRFRRRKDKYRFAQRPIFLTAPNVFAHLEGYQSRILEPHDYREWKERLERAAGLQELEDAELRYALPLLPDPDADFQFVNEEGETVTVTGKVAWWGLRLEQKLGRRLRQKRRRLMFRVWQFFVGRWKVSAMSVSARTGTATGWPRAIKAADVYLAKKLGVSRHAIARVIGDLDRLGYIQAVMCLPSGQPGKRGIYAYFPASGNPPERTTRRFDVTPQGALAWMREQSSAYLKASTVTAHSSCTSPLMEK